MTPAEGTGDRFHCVTLSRVEALAWNYCNSSFGLELLSHCHEEVETVLDTQTVGICTLQVMWKHTLTLFPHGVQCKWIFKGMVS